MKLWKMISAIIVCWILVIGIVVWAVSVSVHAFAERRAEWIAECSVDHPEYECASRWRPWI